MTARDRGFLLALFADKRSTQKRSLEMSDNEFKVTFPGGVRVDAAYGGFTIRTDQPVRDGGEDPRLRPSFFF